MKTRRYQGIAVLLFLRHNRLSFTYESLYPPAGYFAMSMNCQYLNVLTIPCARPRLAGGRILFISIYF